MIKIAIVGGTGYTGVELLRLLAQHPKADVRAITSRKDAGTKVADMFPSLRGRYELAYCEPAEARLATCDLMPAMFVAAVATRRAGSIPDARRREDPAAAHLLPSRP